MSLKEDSKGCLLESNNNPLVTRTTIGQLLRKKLLSQNVTVTFQELLEFFTYLKNTKP